MKKPFDVLAEGLISKNNRGDWTGVFFCQKRGLPAPFSLNKGSLTQPSERIFDEVQ
jgi:hypothetical protein